MQRKLTKLACRDFIEERLFTQIPRIGRSSTKGAPCSVGVELECFPYRIDSPGNGPTVVPFSGSHDSLLSTLVSASCATGGKPVFGPDAGSTPNAIEFPDGNSFTFEPGGQVEISTPPCENLDQVGANVEGMQSILRRVTQDHGIRFAQIGAQPWFSTAEVGLQVKKQRYKAMDAYFESIGPFGRQMMRQTCSLQVNLEFGCDPSLFMQRFVAANLLSPFATAIFANSSIFEGRVQEQKSYRSFIWRRLDPRRTGIVGLDVLSSTFAMDDLVDAYLDFAMEAPVIYLEGMPETLVPPHFTWAQWLHEPIHGHAPTTEDLANHLTLLFPEVRPRGHVEIRSIDVLPIEWQLVPASFYAGLLLPERQLERTLSCLLPLVPRMDDLLEQAAWGLASVTLSSVGVQLMRLAIEGLASLPSEFQGTQQMESLVRFHEQFTARGKTPADNPERLFHPMNS